MIGQYETLNLEQTDDLKIFFDAYIDSNSYNKAPALLKDKYKIYRKIDNKPYSAATIRKYIQMAMLVHTDYCLQKCADKGFIFDKDEFINLAVRNLSGCNMTKRQFREFLESIGLFESKKEFWDHQYNYDTISK